VEVVKRKEEKNGRKNVDCVSRERSLDREGLKNGEKTYFGKGDRTSSRRAVGGRCGKLKVHASQAEHSDRHSEEDDSEGNVGTKGDEEDDLKSIKYSVWSQSSWNPTERGRVSGAMRTVKILIKRKIQIHPDARQNQLRCVRRSCQEEEKQDSSPVPDE
jgi:hypothetical protein